MADETSLKTSIISDEPHIKALTSKNLDTEAIRRLAEINLEFKQGFDFIKKYTKSVSIFGSARFKEGTLHYEQARSIASKISQDLGYAVVTGGGPGIMEGANRGAFEAGGESYGITIRLPREQSVNKYVNDSIDFNYFFSRKVILSFSAEAYVYFPGGFGTLDEFFEILTLVQTRKIPKVPIILVGTDFWQPLDEYIKKTLLAEHQSINENDVNLYRITDDETEIIEIIKKAPLRKE